MRRVSCAENLRRAADWRISPPVLRACRRLSTVAISLPTFSAVPKIYLGARILLPNLDLFNRPCGLFFMGRAAYRRAAGNRSSLVFARGALRHSDLRAQGEREREE